MLIALDVVAVEYLVSSGGRWWTDGNVSVCFPITDCTCHVKVEIWRGLGTHRLSNCCPPDPAKTSITYMEYCGFISSNLILRVIRGEKVLQ